MNKTTTQTQQTKNPNEIGACWLKYNKNNIEYLSIKLELNGEEHYFKAFLNSQYRHEKHPKYLIFKSNPINNYDEKVVNDNRSSVEKRLTKLD